MIPGIPAEALTPIGALLFIIVILAMLLGFGLLVPRWVARSLIASERKRADEFKELSEIERQRADISQSIAEQLTEQGVTLTHILSAITPPGGTP